MRARALSSRVIVVASLVLYAPMASADEAATNGDSKRASVHFDRGVKLFEDADFGLALVEFKRSYEAAPDYRTLYNIGQVHFQLGDFAEARRMLARYLVEGGARVPAPRRLEVERDLEALKIRTAYIRVNVDVPDAVISLDGQRVATSPMRDQLLVSGGTHSIAVHKQGFLTATNQVSLAGTEERTVDVRLVPAPVQEVEVRSSGLGPVWIGWGVTAALAAGTAGMAVSLASAGDALAEEKAGTTSKAELENKASAVETRQTLTYALGGATLLAAALSTYFTLARRPATLSTPQTGKHRRVRFAASPSGLGATF
jgi:hypothetical protein